MARIEFPKPLKQLLEESSLQAPIRGLADRAGEILADNKLPFFPDYTDHGIDHINLLLKSELDLIPTEVWEANEDKSKPRLLSDADAAVIIGASVLHDIAMHLRPEGFLNLVGKDSRFKPLPWFNERHEGHSADRPWDELWGDYVREARRFSERELTNIVGDESARTWKFEKLPDDPGRWELNHFLVVGEFIRRHHARLAHEVAIYGFPGLPVGSGKGQFPAMGQEEEHALKDLADLIGLTARSHGTSLRVCQAYLDWLYPNTPRPMDTAVLYPMALLRVADYLQLDKKRAPAVLLQLRNPPSPISVQEWRKHQAVRYIGPATARRGTVVTVQADLSHSLYLQLRDLLSGLQAEMDHSTAVLDEVYGNLEALRLDHLNLATRRVHSNLHDPNFRARLAYVPERTGFTADPNLLTLLVEPLYGKHPSVGVRELMQNAADAVVEMEEWSKTHGEPVDLIKLAEADCDVLIDFEEQPNGSWWLRVQDRGIGMTSDTIQNYFLRAGASFRRSAEWSKEFLDDQGKPRVARAGRFGIGVFAVFLLGPLFRLSTRHAGAHPSQGYTIEASANSQLIEIRRVEGLPIGTTLEVELSGESVESLQLNADQDAAIPGTREFVDWFCWDWPRIVKRIVGRQKIQPLRQKFSCPIRRGKLPPEWSVIHPPGFDAVYWTFASAPRLSCNGLIVAPPFNFGAFSRFISWPESTWLERPSIAVLDSSANLPLTTQRYELSKEVLPFLEPLARDVVMSFIAHALVRTPTSPFDRGFAEDRHPLQSRWVRQFDPDRLNLEHEIPKMLLHAIPCMTMNEMIPADTWLFQFLNKKFSLLYGYILISNNNYVQDITDAIDLCGITKSNCSVSSSGCAILPCPVATTVGFGFLRRSSAEALSLLVHSGIKDLGQEVEAAHVVVSSVGDFTKKAVEGETAPFPDDCVKFDLWKKVSKPKADRRLYEGKSGNFHSDIPIESIVRDMERTLLGDIQRLANQFSTSSQPILFAAEIRTKPVKREPESLLAKVWNECLGPRAIPFDPVAREALIARGYQHPELKRHIDAWREMSRPDYQGWHEQE